MSDGMIPVTVTDVFGRPATIKGRAEGGYIVLETPAPGYKIDPKRDVDQVRNLLDVLTVQALGQKRS